MAYDPHDNPSADYARQRQDQEAWEHAQASGAEPSLRKRSPRDGEGDQDLWDSLDASEPTDPRDPRWAPAVHDPNYDPHSGVAPF